MMSLTVSFLTFEDTVLYITLAHYWCVAQSHCGDIVLAVKWVFIVIVCNMETNSSFMFGSRK